jgi:competence ComEA-like helix-hairpin-helix protein
MTPARARAAVVVVVVLAGVGAVLRSEPVGEAIAPCAAPALRNDGVVGCDGVGDDVGDRIWLFGGRLDLNTASARSLSRIQGIGDGTARAIVEHRERAGPYRTVDDLDDVAGIGPKTLERLRAVIEVR